MKIDCRVESLRLRFVSKTPHLDLKWILAFIFDDPDYALTLEAYLDQTQYLKYTSLMERRIAGEPLAYVIGQVGFWDMDLVIKPGVLIPRPESELLVEQALLSFPDDRNISVLDLGCGSGAIALAIAKSRPAWKVSAIDQSEQAVACAIDNMQYQGLNQIEIAHSSWQMWNQNGALTYDLIVSNPPYISPDDLDIDPYVKQYEPYEALFAQDDGMACFNDLLPLVKKWLNPGGRVILEHGHLQGQQLERLLRSYGFHDIILFQDLSGNDRVTVAVI